MKITRDTHQNQRSASTKIVRYASFIKSQNYKRVTNLNQLRFPLNPTTTTKRHNPSLTTLTHRRNIDERMRICNSHTIKTHTCSTHVCTYSPSTSRVHSNERKSVHVLLQRARLQRHAASRQQIQSLIKLALWCADAQQPSPATATPPVPESRPSTACTHAHSLLSAVRVHTAPTKGFACRDGCDAELACVRAFVRVFLSTAPHVCFCCTEQSAPT